MTELLMFLFDYRFFLRLNPFFDIALFSGGHFIKSNGIVQNILNLSKYLLKIKRDNAILKQYENKIALRFREGRFFWQK